MPEKISKTSSGGYKVTGPHGTHAKNTTKEKAESQVRLLNAIEHGFVPGESRDGHLGRMEKHNKQSKY